MKTSKSLVAFSLLLLVSLGCQNENGIPDGLCVIDVQTISQADDLIITLLSLTFQGKHYLTVFEENDLETIWVEPNKETGLSVLVQPELENRPV